MKELKMKKLAEKIQKHYNCSMGNYYTFYKLRIGNAFVYIYDENVTIQSENEQFTINLAHNFDMIVKFVNFVNEWG